MRRVVAVLPRRAILASVVVGSFVFSGAALHHVGAVCRCLGGASSGIGEHGGVVCFAVIIVGFPVAANDAAVVTHSGLAGCPAVSSVVNSAVNGVDVAVAHVAQTFSVAGETVTVVGGMCERGCQCRAGGDD